LLISKKLHITELQEFKMIETPRLILRPFSETDANEAFEWLGDEIVMKYIPYGHDKSVAQSEKRIKTYMEQFDLYGYSKYVVVEKHTGKLIGDCGIMNLHGLDLNELGYRMARKYWGKGFATEAASAVLNYAHKNLGFTEIYAIVEKQNTVSVHMIQDKFGFLFKQKIQCFDADLDLYYIDLNKMTTVLYK
jgi:ribosomal-protein-alanine N-acetyltransferase